MAKNERPELGVVTEAQAALVKARAMPQGPGRAAAIELLRCRKPALFDMLPTHTESFMQCGGIHENLVGVVDGVWSKEHDCRTL